MKAIMIYDVEAEAIDKFCDNNDMSEAEFIERLMEYAQDMMDDYDMK